MFIVRPARTSDIPALLELASGVTQGVHTMAKTPAGIERVVELSLLSFASQVDMPGEETYLFVLEDSNDHSLVGSAAIAAAACPFSASTAAMIWFAVSTRGASSLRCCSGSFPAPVRCAR